MNNQRLSTYILSHLYTYCKLPAMGIHIALICLLLFSSLTYSLQFSSVSRDIQHFNSTPGEDDQCPLWEVRNSISGKCECGNDVHNLVFCKETPYNLQLYSCYCMTLSPKELLLIGSCQYTCQKFDIGYSFSIAVNSTSQLNEFMCSVYNRQGQLSGSCVPGYAPPVYSYYIPLLCQLHH